LKPAAFPYITTVIPAKAGIQYSWAVSLVERSGILGHRLEPVIGRRVAPTRWRMMTAVLAVIALTISRSPFRRCVAPLAPYV
jgi:hypothetical protein